jgi:hypothetical protein
MTKIHGLKLDARYFEEAADCTKTFEIRKNDRDFHIGDVLELREWIQGIDAGRYTGEVCYKIITYILDDPAYLRDGYVCLGVMPTNQPTMAQDWRDLSREANHAE